MAMHEGGSHGFKQDMSKDPDNKKGKKSGLRRLKMKLRKIVLDNNKQTEEALKHVYTVLLANPYIEVSIDLPFDKLIETVESIESSDEEQDEEEDNENASPGGMNTAVFPLPDKQKLITTKKTSSEHPDIIATIKNDGGADAAEEGADGAGQAGEAGEDGKKRNGPPAFCRSSACRPCR